MGHFGQGFSHKAMRNTAVLGIPQPNAEPCGLRVGVVLDHPSPPRWVKQALDEIVACPTLELVAIVTGHPGATEELNSVGEGSPALFRLWASLDYMARHTGDSALSPTHLPVHDYPGTLIQLDGVEVSAGDLESVKNAGVEVLVDLSHTQLGSKLHSAAAYGVLRFGSGARCEQTVSTESWNHDEACFEVVDEVHAYDGLGTQRILGRASAIRNPLSLYRVHDLVGWRRPAFLVRKLREIGQHGWEETWSQAESPGQIARGNRDTSSGNLATMRALGRTLVDGVTRVMKRQCMHAQWFIALRESTETPGLKDNVNGFHIIRPPRGRYYADPFLIKHRDKHYIFFEDYILKQRKGVISYMPYIPGVGYGEAKVALETEYHLSYPLIFHWQGEIFMMPETSKARRIEVFRAVEFPGKWQREAVLINNVVAYDPTLVEYDGKFWLFFSGMVRHGGENQDLWLYYSDTPFGKWHAHPQNPIVSDVRRARPAGCIFMEDGHLYRPGQDCTRVYGHAVSLNLIEVLTTTRYSERTVGRIGPNWLPGNVGTHTFNRNGTVQVIDGRVWVPRWGTR
ncbi:MAG TPA: hypothetical protein VD837_12620 [Terriglobales bacterium]|nr:hypothetical protein [Terriglobales bacterium]